MRDLRSMGVSRLVKRLPPPSINPTRSELGGVTLFLVLTACWLLGFASAELGWIGYGDYFFPIAAGLSAMSVVLTGYLIGRTWVGLWLWWVPGATMLAIGFSMTPAPGGEWRGVRMIVLGWLLLIFGWVYFLPLIAIGAALRRRRVKRLASARVHTNDRRSAWFVFEVGTPVVVGLAVVVVGLAATALPRDSSRELAVDPPGRQPDTVGAEDLCKRDGIRYAGTTDEGAEVCFTLDPDGTAWIEIGFSFVSASGCPNDGTGTTYIEGPIPVDASGRIDLPGFEAMIRGSAASGVLEDSEICPGRNFEWSARRAP